MFKSILLLCLCSGTFSASPASDIKNLIGEPDYRRVKLHWETQKSSQASDGYQIRYCELQSWGAQRCRTKTVKENDSNQIEDDIVTYTTDVGGLRMATTYSFEVKVKKEQGTREDRAEGDDKNQNIIVIPTKGFSAKATQCLPHASEIEVSTGPYFGGRIAVEATDGERCALDGEPNSPRDTYTLRINHSECGSQVNETTVATFVLVQENLPILTHSTRRFLVLCTYQPETLTVRAGINLPTHHRGQGHANIALEENNSVRQGRNMRAGRLLQKPEALVHQEEFQDKPSHDTEAIVFFTLLIMGLIVIIAIFVLKWKRADDDFETASMTSAASCSTIAEVEVINENTISNNTNRSQ